MANRADLQALIERVEKATGPDRDLDAAVFVAVTGAATWSYDDNCHIDALIKSGAYRGDKQLHPDYDPNPRVTWRYRIGDAEYGEVPSLSASIDAALALLERVLPGWKVMIHAGGMWGEVMPGASISEPGFAALSRKGLPYRLGKANAPSLPLAIIAATIRAMQSQENE